MHGNIERQIIGDTSQVIFQILGMAIAIATFIPTLIYGYSRDLRQDLKEGLMELDDEKWPIEKELDNEKLENGKKIGIKTFDIVECIVEFNNKIKAKKLKLICRIAGFIYSIDLIVTQTMILVFLTSIIGLLIYLKIAVYGTFKSSNSFGYGLLAVFIIHLVIVIISTFKFCTTYAKSGHYKKIWPAWKGFLGVFAILVIYCGFQIYLSSSIICDSSSSTNTQDSKGYYCAIRIIVVSVFILLLATISWIVPLGIYNPLTTILRKTIENHSDIK